MENRGDKKTEKDGFWVTKKAGMRKRILGEIMIMILLTGGFLSTNPFRDMMYVLIDGSAADSIGGKKE